jgi:hypothetical protein
MQTVVEPISPELESFEPPEPPQDEDGDEGDGRGDERWITVRTFWEPMAAHLAQAQLEQAQIDSVLLDVNLVATDWLMANAVGGIKLQVRASDLAEADRVLLPEIVPTATTVGTAETVTAATTCCPRCSSDEIYQESLWRRPAVILLIGATVASLGLLLFIVLPWIMALPRNWHCLRCGHEWLSQRRGFNVQSPSNGSSSTLDPAGEL